MKASSPGRLVVIAAACLVLATVLALQAASTAAMRRAPELAATLFSANGAALERATYQRFATLVEDPTETRSAARQIESMADRTHLSHPLSPKAHAVRAMAMEEGSERSRFLEIASSLNRRDIVLQGVMLQEHLERANYERIVGTLDEIMRVGPQRSEEIFPVLVQALADDEAIPFFADIFRAESPWHEDFLIYAVQQPQALSNLAALRGDIATSSAAFDRILIMRLVRAGEIDQAETVYRQFAGGRSGFAGDGVIDWNAAFPPFEWTMVDEPGLRAQTSLDGEQLELSVRPGKGGVVATRLLELPPTPFEIRLDHDLPVDQSEDVRISLTCAGARTAQPLFDRGLGQASENILVSSAQPGCSYALLAIHARAWTGRAPLRGTIGKLSISAVN